MEQSSNSFSDTYTLIFGPVFHSTGHERVKKFEADRRAIS
jgi:hypothetical protein